MDKIQQMHQFKHYCLIVLQTNNTFIQQGSIKLIKSDSKNIFDVTVASGAGPRAVGTERGRWSKW